MKITAIRSVVVAMVVMLLAAIAVSGALAETTVGKLTVTITNKAITIDPKAPKGDMAYNVTVRNRSSQARGLKMSGKDKAGTEFARYTRVMAPGASQTIRFFFPSDRQVAFRELFSYNIQQGSITNAAFGKMRAKVLFR